jgi:hypothetical protein
MKKNTIKQIIIIATLLSNVSFGQTINLGILTGEGGVGKTGGTVTGDVGTNGGAITGIYIGNTYITDTNTVQARKDLMRAYIHLSNKVVDFPGTHAPFFGGGETITPGVYYTAGAGSVGGAIKLDGGGDPDSLFIIKFGGALTVSANSTVTLTGVTQSCNVFWIA